MQRSKLSMAVAAALVLAAHGAWAQQKVTLTVYGDQGQNLTAVEWLKPLAAARGITLQTVGVPFTSVYEKLKTEFVGGTGAYDVVIFYPAYLGEFAEFGYVQPLDPLFPVHDPKMSDVVPAYRDLYDMYNGKTYALPYDGDILNLYFVKHIFEDAGEKAAFKAKYGYDLAPAATLEQIRDIAEFFTRPKGAKLAGETLASDYYGIVLEGIRGGTTFVSVWNNFIRNWGGDLFDKDGKPTFDRPENIAAVKFWADLWKFSPPGQAEYSLIDVPTVMGNGIAAQTIAWSDFVLGIDRPGASKLTGKFVYRGVPGKKGQTTPRHVETEPSTLVISTHTKAPEATYLFLEWMADKATQTALIDALGGGVPIRNSLWDTPTLKNSKNASLFAAMKDSMQYGYAKPRAPKLYEIYDVMGATLQDIATGKVTAEQGMKDAQQKVSAICQKCFLD